VRCNPSNSTTCAYRYGTIQLQAELACLSILARGKDLAASLKAASAGTGRERRNRGCTAARPSVWSGPDSTSGNSDFAT
jgi:hypothetical protein